MTLSAVKVSLQGIPEALESGFAIPEEEGCAWCGDTPVVIVTRALPNGTIERLPSCGYHAEWWQA